MIPGQHPITIYQGDSFGDDWLLTLPSLVTHGGPADLVGAEVTAQVRPQPGSDEEILADFDVEIVDAALRKVRPRLTPAQTAAITWLNCVWDLQVAKDGWVGTVLAGPVTLVKGVTA